ncbi:MGMT family protein [Gordonia sp. GN26]
MGDERVFSISGSKAKPAEAVSLAEVGLRERRDLQEWVIEHPEILGAGIMVVTMEFDRWQSGAGQRHADRLDVLGLDRDGQLVLAELKRDRAPDVVQLQAIKYAAMVSRFTPTDLATYHQRYLLSRGQEVTEDEARSRLDDHAGVLDLEVLRRPRIVLVAGEFDPTTTASVVWLNEMGLSITLQQVQAYRTGDEGLVMTVSQLYPVPDVEDFTISPIQAQARSLTQRQQRGAREQSTVVRLVQTGTLPDGTVLYLRPTSEVKAEVREQIEEWLDEDERRGRATWFNNQAHPLRWEFDQQRYRPTAIVSRILSEAAGIDRSVRGPQWWTTADGADLTQLAGSTVDAFDWDILHEALAVIPRGHWTNYGALAEIVGTAPQPVGNHVTHCDSCPNAHRVLGRGGKPSQGFRWSDPLRSDTQQEALQAEGLDFIGNRADPDRYLDSQAISRALENSAR